MGKSAKIWFGHNFWLDGPIDLRPTLLNYILQDLDHIWRAQIWAKNAYLAIFGRVFERAKYGHMECLWKGLAKFSSDALVLGQ